MNNMNNFFKDINLTSDQSTALSKISDFLKSDKQVFILKGYAGTGKTTILKGLSKYLLKNHKLGHIMAPTGRAAKVIQNKTNYPATTIHKYIYDLSKLKTEKYQDKDGNDTFKFYFDFQSDNKEVNKVYIFDESSMISNTYSEGEFFRFGSGYLLEDIIKYFNLTSPTNTKLIFVGDPAQLPPVGDNDSRALMKEFFDSKSIASDEYEMTEVVRQSESSGILYNAKYYRKLIFSKIVSENILNTDFDDVEEVDVIKLSELFTTIAPIPDSKKAVIVTYSNKLAFEYNKIIRQQYYPETPNIAAGDILQIVKNNYSNQQVELLNGDFVKVAWVSDELVSQSAPIKQKGKKDLIIKLYFRKIGLMTYSGNSVEIMILDTLLNSKNRDLSSNEMKALYINFIMRYRQKIGGIENKASTEFKEAFREDPFFNALQVKYGYAITGHKSQGGEWENVFVDFDGRVGISKDVLRWNYTAITRASEKLYVLHPPKLEQVDFSKVKEVNIGSISKVKINFYEHIDVPTTPFHNEHSRKCKRIKYLEIEEILKELGYKIEQVISRDYLEKYYIKSNNKSYIIEMTHNASGVFTSFKSNIVDDETENILKLISEPRQLNFEYKYSTTDTMMSKIFNKVLSAKQNTDAELIYVDDSRKIDFHVDYFFRTKAQVSYLNIYFNKNQIVTNIIAKSVLGENDTTLKKLIDNLIH